MKRVIIAPDSFKESLDACQAAEAIAAGFRLVFPGLDTIKIPMADGGEGLVRALVAATGGELVHCRVTGPLGKPVSAYFGLLGDGRTCVIEMAAASGLPLVPPAERNPLITTTYGTGELIIHALNTGCNRMILGIGGSATHDGGAGMAQALGVLMLTAEGKEIGPGAEGLKELDRVDTRGLDARLLATEVIAAVDVRNPLCGAQGASYVYAAQKGAPPWMLPVLDEALHHYAAVLRRDVGVDVLDIPGAGAAGGLGAGLVAFLRSALRPGVEVVLDVVKMERYLQEGVDLVITGEGEINRQTSFGKVPAGVARLAKKYRVPVLALVGGIGEGAETVLEQGVDAYFSLVPRPMTLDECVQKADILLANAAEQCARMIRALETKPNCHR